MPGQGRLGDRAQAPSDAHGCPGCPHQVLGPAIGGAPTVLVNGRPALRVGDPGIHAACCGTNLWTALAGSTTVFLDGAAAFRKDDPSQHCGGVGKLIEGSENVIVGGGTSNGPGTSRARNGNGGATRGGPPSVGGGGNGGAAAGNTGGSGSGNSGDGNDGLAGDTSVGSSAVPPGESVDPQELVLRVVSPRGTPVANVYLSIVLPDRTQQVELTGDDGVARLFGVRATGDARVVLPDYELDDDADAKVPGATKYRPGGVSASVGAETTIEVPPRVFRGRLLGMVFDTDKTFLLPVAIPGVRELRRFYEAHPGQMLITGHTDRSGAPAYNQALSLDRAAAVAHFVRANPDGWLPWYHAQTASKRFGTREDQMMLSAVHDAGGLPFYQDAIDGNPGAATRDAVTRFQVENGLAVDGIAGDDTRRALIRAYMALQGTTVPESEVIVTHGCGENHPAVGTPDGVRLQANRRVEIFLFEDVIDPAPHDEPAGGCAEYATWVQRTQLTIDLDIAPGTIVATVVDESGAHLADARVHLSGPIPADGTTGSDGSATFADVIAANYQVVVELDGYEPTEAVASVLPGDTVLVEVRLEAARGSLAVQVTDDLGAPLDRIHIELVGPTPSTQDGPSHAPLAFPGLRPGVYTIRASRIGYEDGTVDAQVVARIDGTATVALPPRTWTAAWDEPTTNVRSLRRLRLTAPGLPAGEPVRFDVSQDGSGVVGYIDVDATADGADAELDEWLFPETIAFAGDLDGGAPFPEVRFTFEALVAGRRIASAGPVTYADRLEVAIVDAEGTPIADRPYSLHSMWGRRFDRRTDARGVVVEEGLPPGGVHLFLDDGTLIELENEAISDSEKGS